MHPLDLELVEAIVKDEMGEVVDAGRGDLLQEAFEVLAEAHEQHRIEPREVALEHGLLEREPAEVALDVVEQVPRIDAAPPVVPERSRGLTRERLDMRQDVLDLLPQIDRTTSHGYRVSPCAAISARSLSVVSRSSIRSQGTSEPFQER